MNMHAFYRRLTVKPSESHQRRLANLTRISRAQVVQATADTEWFVWHAEMPNT
jgi:hypothetical protein